MLIENCVYSGKVVDSVLFWIALSVQGTVVGLPDNRIINYHLSPSLTLESAPPGEVATFRIVRGVVEVLQNNVFIPSPFQFTAPERFGELFTLSNLPIKNYTLGSSPVITGEGTNGYFATFNSTTTLSTSSRFYLVPLNIYRGQSIVLHPSGGISTFTQWVLTPSKFLYSNGWLTNQLNAFSNLFDAQYGFWYTQEPCGGCAEGEGCFYNDEYSYGTTPIPSDLYKCVEKSNYHRGKNGLPGGMGAQGGQGLPGRVGPAGRRGEPGTGTVEKVNWASLSGLKLLLLSILVIVLAILSYTRKNLWK